MRSNRLAVAIIALILVTAAVPVTTGPVQAQSQTPTPTPDANTTDSTPTTTATPTPTPTPTPSARDAVTADARQAGLTVEQPHYVDGSVDRQTENGTVVYEASGQVLRLYPTSFGVEDVVAIRTQPDVAIERTASGTGWLLRPDQDGSYTITWEVDETVATDNGTTTERRTYQAIIRSSQVEGVTVVDADEYQSARSDARKWRKINSTAADEAEKSLIWALLPGEPDSEAWIRSGLDKQLLVHNPFTAFSDGLTLLVFGLFSLAGALFLAILLGWHASAVRYLSRRLNIFESIEAEEGSVATRLERQHIEDKQQSLQNEKHSNIYLPHEADAMREVGETPLEADVNIWADTVLPSASVALKARAMGKSGYVGVVPEEVALPDGGDGSDGHADDRDGGAHDDAEHRDADASNQGDADRRTAALVAAVREAGARLRIERREDVSPDATTVDLTAADRDWHDVLPVDEDSMLEFDPAGVDVDRPAMSVADCDWTVEDLVVRSGLEMDHFESAAAAGRHLRDFLAWAREHPATDASGAPRPERYALETWLRNAQLLDDRFGIPKQHAIDVLEAAIQDDDPVAEGREMIDAKELGEYA